MLRAMAWKKPSAELVAAFDAALPGAPAERRLMFGFPAAFVNGNMFIGLFEESLILRLDDQLRARLLDGGGTLFEPMKGRAMKEYVVAPEKLVGDRKALATWARTAFAYGQSLPPKAKKPSKKPTTTPSKKPTTKKKKTK
jgi:TfoX/Sxy family transcriptional regulator of competence genes